jgi:hypothetical protein
MAGALMRYTDELKLDFEQKNPQKRLSINRVKFVAQILRLKIVGAEAYRTANGIHISLKTAEKMHPIFAVQVQTLMNSDYARESYNVIRTYNLTMKKHRYPPTAFDCWNVLYYKKVTKGEVVSQEKFDEKLTEKLRRELIGK